MKQRDQKGKFVNGNNAGPGRPPGSKNKAPKEIRETFLEFLGENLKGMQASFEKLEPREQFDVLLKMAKYVLPTLKAIEIEAPEPRPINVIDIWGPDEEE